MRSDSGVNRSRAVGATKTRVLIADDSALVRFSLKSRLGQESSIEIVGEAVDGVDVVEKARSLCPDVVTLDVEMPRRSGLDALGEILTCGPISVIMLSAQTQVGAGATIEALDRGAFDFVPKPSHLGNLGIGVVADQLIAKIKAAAEAQSRDGSAPAVFSPSGGARPIGPRKLASRSSVGSRLAAPGSVVVVGCSTGGPRALTEVIPRLPSDFPTGVVVVQHMPPGFTDALARRLDAISSLQVKEAAAGDRVQPGLVLVAPGDQHLLLSDRGVVRLSQDPPYHGVRPAADPTMLSAAQAYGRGAIGVILTGMGIDGRAGAIAIKHAGGVVVAEDASTCAVYGMPRAAVEAGVVDSIAPIQSIAATLIDLLAQP